jgi:hypothetical protein
MLLTQLLCLLCSVVFSSQGMGMGYGTVSVDTAAAMMVAALRSFYWVQVNRTIVTEQLGTMLFNTLYQLQGLNMTTEDQAHWNTPFLQLQLSQR